MREFASFEPHEREEPDERDPLEPWESASSRHSREAWRGSADREVITQGTTAVSHESPVPTDLFQQLAAAAAREIQQQLVLRRLEEEIRELRTQMAELQKERFFHSGSEAALLQKFEEELAFLERDVDVEDSLTLDLGYILNEWD